jgi:hypothetical protein
LCDESAAVRGRTAHLSSPLPMNGGTNVPAKTLRKPALAIHETG